MVAQSLTHLIREKIGKGELAVGHRLPSERWIATNYGVSRATVQIAVRELVQEGFLEHLPNCRPTVRSTSNHKVERDQVAIWILPEVQDLGGMLMLQGIRSALGSANYRILLGSRSPNQTCARAEMDFLKQILASPNTAGVIVWDFQSEDCHQIYLDLVAKGIELVFLDRAPAHPVRADFVATDNVQAARNAVRHLIELGHERIAIAVVDPLASSVRDRVKGYREALEEAEISVDLSLIVECSKNCSVPMLSRCQSLIQSLREQPNPPTAIFAVNDSVGLHLLEAARNMGITVPGELSIVGFDWLLRNLPFGGELTSVAQPFEEIGRVAAERLLARISASEPQTPRKILFDAPLALRNSTGAPFKSPRNLSPQKENIYAQA